MTPSQSAPHAARNRHNTAPLLLALASTACLAQDYPSKPARIVVSLSPLVFSRYTYARLPYDSLTDFTPLTTLAMTPMMLAVHPSVPASSIKTLIALAKAQPGKLAFATAGSGGMSHMVLELFRSTTGVRLQPSAWSR
jgi:Tripartite tricarboxylate transporter family receptor